VQRVDERIEIVDRQIFVIDEDRALGAGARTNRIDRQPHGRQRVLALRRTVIDDDYRLAAVERHVGDRLFQQREYHRAAAGLMLGVPVVGAESFHRAGSRGQLVAHAKLLFEASHMLPNRKFWEATPLK
jgi:hypothetical protein